MHKDTYALGVPAWAIHLIHLFVGALLVYIGYQGSQGRKVRKELYMALMALGVLVMLYHAYLWWMKVQSH